MNVQELINLLQEVEDKSLRVLLNMDDGNYDIETIDVGTDRVYIDGELDVFVLKVPQAIREVKWFAKNKEFITFEFETRDAYEIDFNEFDLFRFFHHYESGNMEVLVANREDYFIHEDVSDMFNLRELDNYLKSLKDIEDASEEFNEWLERHKEPVD